MKESDRELAMWKIKAAEELQRRAVKENYSKYVEYVHGGRWIPAKHLLFVCDKIQAFIETYTGHAYDILILQMPPQHGKSMSTTETLPSWYLGINPEHRVIQASYNEGFAIKFCRRNKEKINKYGKQLFDITIGNVNKADEFELDNNVGGMLSRGLMGGITGNPANLIIIDDPVKNRQEADSETYRENMWDEWQNSVKTRLAAGAKIIVIMTRWHEDDLAGRIITNEKYVTVINLPCEAEENDLLGRQKGDALFPEIGKDNNWLKDFKEGYQTTEGHRAWLALFQGRPTAEEGNMIKRHWFRYWKPKEIDLPPVTVKDKDGNYVNIYAEDIPDYMDESIQSWDCTFKKKEDNDFVCGGVISRRLAKYYLRDLINDRMGIVETMKSINIMSQKWKEATLKLVEDKANGSAVIEMLQDKIPGMVPVEPKGDKVSRANAVSPCIESGNFYIPHPMIAPWVNEYLEQMCAFPLGKNDDMVDMTTQGLTRLISRTFDTQPPEQDPDNPSYEYKYQKMVSDIMGGEAKINL
jgi:predicted phage terminase large subunit-like protein